MIYTLKEFLENIIVESLHPELQQIVSGPTSFRGTHKQTQIANKMRELTRRGEQTGVEGKMPKGSSRAYLGHKEPYEAIVDGKPASFLTGTKIAIHSPLAKYHDPSSHYGMSLGELQNEAENEDHHQNERYRVLTHKGGNSFETNENGIFPPLIEHDPGHQWAHVGHARNITRAEFKKLTRTPSHPDGISHDEWYSALARAWSKDHGKYWHQGMDEEAHMDHIESHPLVQKFLDHQRTFHAPPHDYWQLQNMGVFEHPNGSRHIVARDFGFNQNVSRAYRDVFAAKDKEALKRFGR